MDYTKPISTKFSDEMYEKVMTGVKEFNWSPEFVRTTFFSVGNSSKVELSNNEQRSYQEDAECHCYYAASCPGYNNDCHEPDKCKSANTDCGVFGGTKCDGFCTAGVITTN